MASGSDPLGQNVFLIGIGKRFHRKPFQIEREGDIIMKKTVILLMMFLSAGLFAREAGDITGLWYGQEDSAGRVPVVEIFEENGLFYAYSFGYKEGDAGLNDDNNPDPQMRGLPLKGLVYLFDLAFSKDEWKGGRIYNPESGKIYYAKASLSDDGNRLNIKATIDGAGLFGKTLTWTRVPASEQNRFTPLSKDQLRFFK